MKKILFLLLMLFSVNVLADFSNLIIFGDSLSDVGNFPESPDYLNNPNEPASITNLTSDIYVPFSNPVDTSQHYFIVPRDNQKYPFPVLDNDYLSPQATLNNQQRLYRSIGWAQFFLVIADQDHLIASQTIVPSYLLSQRAIPDNFSVDYGWGYATSSSGCVNPKYAKMMNCTHETVLTARADFVNQPDRQHFLSIRVPNLQTQVTQFLQDMKNHKVMVDNKTCYVFWIGGNDLISAVNRIVYSFNLSKLWNYLWGSTALHTIMSVHKLLMRLPAHAQPQKIYVFTLFNPGLTPFYYHYYALGIVGDFCVIIANSWLKLDVTLFNLFSKTKIVLVPAYHWFDENAQNTLFQKEKGQACQLSGGDFSNAQVIPSNNCDGFLFWNAVHPAMPAQIITAYRFAKLLQTQ